MKPDKHRTGKSLRPAQVNEMVRNEGSYAGRPGQVIRFVPYWSTQRAALYASNGARDLFLHPPVATDGGVTTLFLGPVWPRI